MKNKTNHEEHLEAIKCILIAAFFVGGSVVGCLLAFGEPKNVEPIALTFAICANSSLFIMILIEGLKPLKNEKTWIKPRYHVEKTIMENKKKTKISLDAKTRALELKLNSLQTKAINIAKIRYIKEAIKATKINIKALKTAEIDNVVKFLQDAKKDGTI